MRPAVTILMLISLAPCAALADVYRSVDAQGHVQYSDLPSPGAERVSGMPSGSSPPPDSSKNGALDKEIQQVSQRLAQQKAARDVQKDTEQARAAQCKQAQDAYQKAVQARRIYNTGPDGERQYLTDEQADQERVSYRLAMEAACKDEQ